MVSSQTPSAARADRPASRRALQRPRGDLEQADRAIGARHDETPVARIRCRARADFEHVRRRCACPWRRSRRSRLADHDAGQPHRAAGMRAAAGRTVSVSPVMSRHRSRRHAEPFGRRAARSSSRGPGPLDSVPITSSTAPSGRDGDLGPLARRAAVQLDIVGDADAAQRPRSRALRAGAPRNPPSRRAPARAVHRLLRSRRCRR